MKKTLRKNILEVSCAFLTLFLLSSWYLVHAYARDPLPERLWIYVNKNGKIKLIPASACGAKVLPVANISLKHPGCYISCHSTNPDKAVYAVSPIIYVIGLIRIEGQYEGQICRPRDYETAEIRDEEVFQELCSKTYQCIGNSCWAGGKTGELFGLK